jgi:hypothetical protein
MDTGGFGPIGQLRLTLGDRLRYLAAFLEDGRNAGHILV